MAQEGLIDLADLTDMDQSLTNVGQLGGGLSEVFTNATGQLKRIDLLRGKLLLHTPDHAFITFSYPKLLNHTPSPKKGI